MNFVKTSKIFGKKGKLDYRGWH